MKFILKLFIIFPVISLCINCTSREKIDIIFDTDANNEIDDQHALAYLFFNSNTFNIKAITVNSTINGGNIDMHYDEAKRIMQLCNWEDKTLLLKGASSNFKNIEASLNTPNFDGYKAVSFIIEEALKFNPKHKLVVLAVGKLTNVALAVKKEPLIIPNIRLVWLGSNFPEPGEYNLKNDIYSMNFLLETQIEFEMVTVRYGKSSGTDFVKVSKEEVEANIPSLGSKIKIPVIGRHGGEFFTFGKYAKSLFDNTSFYGNPPSRSLFDMAAVAIVKNPSWGQSSEIPSPIMIDENWVERPNNFRKIKIWENFERELILKDFYKSLTIGK
tara:strand:+ start:516 stop:1499 length:984 start_codon:yes stop_codon:yes gene_type:complete